MGDELRNATSKFSHITVCLAMSHIFTQNTKSSHIDLVHYCDSLVATVMSSLNNELVRTIISFHEEHVNRNMSYAVGIYSDTILYPCDKNVTVNGMLTFYMEYCS